MGRDMMVLNTWQETGKPPLLGPQTSALPFNQSAIYFYILYPAFLISNGSPMSSLFTLASLYIFAFIIGLFLLNKYKSLVSSYLLTVPFFLLSIHPQYITQGRFVWNPSFVTPFLISSILSFYILINKFSHKLLAVFSLSIAIAVSLSYSVAPLLIIFALYWLLFNRKNFIKYFLYIFASFFIINLPTIFFELRHKFLLTSSLFTKNSPVQDGVDFFTKINNLSQFIFSLQSQNLNMVIFISSLLLSLVLLYKNFKSKYNLQFITSFLYLGIVATSFVTPVSTQAHYIFAFTSLLFIVLSTLHNIFLIPIIIFFMYFYLQPNIIKNYFKIAPRTLTSLQQCFTQYCHDFDKSSFVSVNSNFHPFHNGPEHRFLLKKAGCKIHDIETENGNSKYMTLVLDNGKYDSKTKYYELDLFGNHKEVSRLKCQENFEIVTLEKE